MRNDPWVLFKGRCIANKVLKGLVELYRDLDDMPAVEKTLSAIFLTICGIMFIVFMVVFI